MWLEPKATAQTPGAGQYRYSIYDLVVLCYIHVRAEVRDNTLVNAAAALAPGGTLLFVGVAPADEEDSPLPSELAATPLH